MPKFVKTHKDEELWSESKNIAKDKGLSGDNMYAYANAIFHRMKGKKEVDENNLHLNEEKLKLYSQLDYLVNNLNEEEIWYTMKSILEEHPNFNVELDESEQYEALEYLFENYKNTINNSEYSIIKEYIDSMVIPEASCKINERNIKYGVLEEDYISGGFGGLGSAEYGYGGTGYSGGRARRRGFGGPRRGGQMSRRATGNPFRKPTGGDVEEPIVVNIDQEKSNYKPWEVQLTPSGDKVNSIKRHKKQSQFDDLMDSELSSAIRGLESAGLDLDELNEMTQDEIEDLLIKKLRTLGEEVLENMEQMELTESKNDITPFKTLIDESFSFDIYRLEEKLRKSSRIQDARQILADKHNVHKAIEKNKDRSYVLDQYAIDKLMREFGYTYDENNVSWIKQSKKTDIKKPKKPKLSADDQEEEPKSDTDTKNGNDTKSDISVLDTDDDFENDEDEVTSEYEEEDFEKFGNEITDPVKLESKLKPLMARYILSVDQVDKKPSKFTMNAEGKYVPEIDDEKINEMMYDLKYDWDGDKDIWVDDTNTIPKRIFEAGENRKTLVGRAYLAAMGELPAIQFDMEGIPLFNKNEVSERMNNSGFAWNEEINKWTFENKDLAGGAEQLNESVMLEQDKNQIQPAIKASQQRDLQARYLYRAIQFNALKEAPDQKDEISLSIKNANPVLFDNGLNANEQAGISIEQIEELLTEGDLDNEDENEKEVDNQEDSTENVDDKEVEKIDQMRKKLQKEDYFRNKINNVFNEQEDEDIDITGEEEPETGDDEGIDITGEEEPETDEDTKKDTTQKEKIYSFIGEKLVPRQKYQWDRKKLMWTEDGEIPNVITELGDDIQSYMGRTVLASETGDPKPLQIKNNGKTLVSADRIKSLLEDEENINWMKTKSGGMWIKGEAPLAKPDELNEREQRLKEIDQKILEKYNNGDGFDIDNLPATYRDLLFDAIIGQKIMGSGMSEKEWYSSPMDDKKAQKKAARRRRKMIDNFKNKYKVSLKEIPEDEKTNPAHTHRVEIKKRESLFSKGSKAALETLWNLTKKVGQDVSSRLRTAVMVGMMAAASMDGYQGPYKFLPLGLSQSWRQYENLRRERLLTTFLGGRQPDTGQSSRTKSPKGGSKRF